MSFICFYMHFCWDICFRFYSLSVRFVQITPEIFGTGKFATYLYFLIPISSQSDGLNYRYFKLRLLDQTEFIV